MPETFSELQNSRSVFYLVFQSVGRKHRTKTVSTERSWSSRKCLMGLNLINLVVEQYLHVFDFIFDHNLCILHIIPPGSQTNASIWLKNTYTDHLFLQNELQDNSKIDNLRFFGKSIKKLVHKNHIRAKTSFLSLFRCSITYWSCESSFTLTPYVILSIVL